MQVRLLFSVPSVPKTRSFLSLVDSVSARETSGPATILVVDDEQPIRAMIEKMLMNCGYSILNAGSGDEAISICERSAGSIELLVTDVTMPGMSGFELAQRVAERWPDIKILFVSGFATDCGVQRKLRHRPLLQKPFTRQDITAKVRALLGAAVSSAPR